MEPGTVLQPGRLGCSGARGATFQGGLEELALYPAGVDMNELVASTNVAFSWTTKC